MNEISPVYLKEMARSTGASLAQVEQSCRRLISQGLMALDHAGMPRAVGESLTMMVTDEDVAAMAKEVMVERRAEILMRMRRRARA